MIGGSTDREITEGASKRAAFFSGPIKWVAFSVVGIGAVGMMGLGIYSATTDDGPPTKPVDTGSSTIAQTVANPPDFVAEKPVVTKQEPVAKVDPEPSKQPFTSTTIVLPKYVVLPTNNSGGLFEVPAVAVVQNKADAPHQSEADAAASTARIDATRVAFQSTTMTGGKAGPALHLTYVMMPQTIPCSLDTAMDSTLAGPLICHTTQDVLSPAHIILMPVGTSVVGTYRNDVRNGQHRLFTLTGNAFTKDGIPVPLNSPIADGLGRTGIEGDYNGHNLEKFGAAVALTAFQSATQMAQAALTNGNQSNTNFNFSGGGGSGGIESLATEILHQQATIQATISVPHGSIVSIVIDHVIDFSEALHVESR